MKHLGNDSGVYAVKDVTILCEQKHSLFLTVSLFIKPRPLSGKGKQNGKNPCSKNIKKTLYRIQWADNGGPNSKYRIRYSLVRTL